MRRRRGRGVRLTLLSDGTTVTCHRDRVETVFPDGSSTSNWPPGDQAFADVAQACGFGPGQLMDYVWEHELCHTLVPQVLFGTHGYVATMSAQGRRMSLAAARAEERLVWYAQRIASYAYDMTWSFDEQFAPVVRFLWHLRETELPVTALKLSDSVVVSVEA